MFLTNNDLEKIYRYILSKSVKDTDFGSVSVLLNNDYITIIQDGYNKKIAVKDLVDEIFKLNTQDLLNVTDEYNSHNINIEEAIRLVSYKAKKEGLVITFQNKESKWELWQFTGSLNQWNNLTLWKNLLDFKDYVIDSILPDEEDLTTTESNVKGNALMKLKDREYNVDNPNGMGYIILRNNFTKLDNGETKNILTQLMFGPTNTIYEIRYDYDLNEETISIPDNCVLKFNGGSLFNGTIIIGHSQIEANKVKIFDNIKFRIPKENKDGSISMVKDSYEAITSYPEWYGAVGQEGIDDSDALQQCMDNFVVVEFSKMYYINKTINVHGKVKLISSTLERTYALNKAYMRGIKVMDTITALYVDGKPTPYTEFNSLYMDGICLYGFPDKFTGSTINKYDYKFNGIDLDWGGEMTFMKNSTISGFEFGIISTASYITAILDSTISSCRWGIFTTYGSDWTIRGGGINSCGHNYPITNPDGTPIDPNTVGLERGGAIRIRYAGLIKISDVRLEFNFINLAINGYISSGNFDNILFDYGVYCQMYINPICPKGEVVAKESVLQAVNFTNCSFLRTTNKGLIEWAAPKDKEVELNMVGCSATDYNYNTINEEYNFSDTIIHCENLGDPGKHTINLTGCSFKDLDKSLHAVRNMLTIASGQSTIGDIHINMDNVTLPTNIDLNTSSVNVFYKYITLNDKNLEIQVTKDKGIWGQSKRVIKSTHPIGKYPFYNIAETQEGVLFGVSDNNNIFPCTIYENDSIPIVFKCGQFPMISDGKVVMSHGSKENRLDFSHSSLFAGFPYFDETLGKIIYWDSINARWTDASGNDPDLPKSGTFAYISNIDNFKKYPQKFVYYCTDKTPAFSSNKGLYIYKDGGAWRDLYGRYVDIYYPSYYENDSKFTEIVEGNIAIKDENANAPLSDITICYSIYHKKFVAKYGMEYYSKHNLAIIVGTTPEEGKIYNMNGTNYIGSNGDLVELQKVNTIKSEGTWNEAKSIENDIKKGYKFFLQDPLFEKYPNGVFIFFVEKPNKWIDGAGNLIGDPAPMEAKLLNI